MKSSKKIISLFLAAVTVITSLFCLAAAASATSNGDLASEMRRFRITSSTKLDSTLKGYYKASAKSISLCVAGLNNKKAAKIEKLAAKEGYVLSAVIMLNSDVGYAIEGEAQAASILTSVSYQEVTGISLSKASSGYKLILDVKSNSLAKTAMEKATAAGISIRAVKTSNGKKTYYGGKSVYYIPFSSKDPTTTKLSALKFKKIASVTYKNRALTPEPEIYDGAYKLQKGVDYTASYKNNDGIGTASVTIKGKGSYTGKKTIKFVINPQAPKLKKAYLYAGYVKVTWASVPGADKYYIYRSDDNGKTFRKIAEYGSGTTSADLDFPGGEGYFLKIRAGKTVNGKTYYSNWSLTTDMAHLAS